MSEHANGRRAYDASNAGFREVAGWWIKTLLGTASVLLLVISWSQHESNQDNRLNIVEATAAEQATQVATNAAAIKALEKFATKATIYLELLLDKEHIPIPQID